MDSSKRGYHRPRFLQKKKESYFAALEDTDSKKDEDAFRRYTATSVALSLDHYLKALTS
ncbi:MAG: hypothetical protein ACK5LK_08170 [Chthoniobacterales bacterium]